MKKMKLILTRVLPCFLALLCVVTLASCKKGGSSYNYPKVIPAISDPNGTFVTIGNYKVTNETVYNRLLQSYGLTAMNDWMDSILLANEAYDPHYSDEDFENNMEQIIYGVDEDDSTKSKYDSLTEEERADALASFQKNMRTMGLFTEEAYLAYYKLEYLRMNFAVKAFKQFVTEFDADEENEEPYFTEEEYKEYYESQNHADLDLIVVTFDSELQARKVMQKHGIDLTSLAGTWKINNVDATAETLKEVFLAMYNEVNVDQISAPKTYTYKELNKISSIISSKAYSLSTLGDDMNKSYTHGPQVYGSRFYLVLKTNASSIESFEDAYQDATKKDDMFHALVENSVSSAYVTKVLNELHNKCNLKIYSEALEVKYVSDYNAAFSALSITEFDAFKTTTEESATNIASFTYNNQTHNLTANQVFDTLSSQYGAILSLLLLQQYVVLTDEKYNTVYDYTTNTIKDQAKYDEYYKSDIQNYKTSFEEGNYESKGYPSAYGWNNFLRDYLGVTNEIELLSNLDGSLYKASQDVLARTLWLDKKEETITDEETGETTTKIVDDDSRVQAEMEKIFNEFFSASIIGVNAYYDLNSDGVADEFTGSDFDSTLIRDGAKAKELVELVYTESAKSNKETLAERLSETVILYKLATNDDPVWGAYKKLGLYLNSISSTSYTNASNINETLKAKIKSIWQSIYEYDQKKNEEDKIIGATITGQNLDPGYRYTANSEAHYVTAEDFGIDAFTAKSSNEEDANDSMVYKIFVIKATAPTFISSSSKTYKPTLADYDKYMKSNSSVGSATASAIKAYYMTAIENLLSIDNTENAVTSNKILEKCTAQLSSTSWTKNNSTLKTQVEQLIADATVVAEE